ncbi:MAG: imidazole glycerol phosphate synthase subunit HisF [Oscillospiraceae bacterium]|nr:imidazole glycerol phosphate synthase subunit HisF [Oscillospiraceae bacterium]
MSEKRIIPCLDIRGGKVVKGVKFEDVKDVGDPVKSAINYNNQGADELVLYDISASIENRIVPLDLVEEIIKNISMPLSVAGGIGNIEDFEKVINAGAERVSVNSLAIRNPDFIEQAAKKFGRKSVVVGIDAKRIGSGKFTVTTGGGKVDVGLDLIEWAKRVEELGAGEICLNSIDADGVKNGYDIEMLNAVCDVVSIPVIASGGCGRLEHFAEVFKKTKASAALAASVFHFGELTVEQVKNYLREQGIQVRKANGN